MHENFPFSFYIEKNLVTHKEFSIIKCASLKIRNLRVLQKLEKKNVKEIR